ncbi:hypothetical protein ACFQZS_05915 [Mucilaginibacter calamicampi]|uniref:DNA-packaging protein gp3 n=1 Tax=Mucilaginibacter calamicampi TaxID=1302352 RepID=A0ABW2YV92_9SPHI
MKSFKRSFKNRAELCVLVDGYFKYIEGEYRIENKPAKKDGEQPTTQKITIREAEPATIASLVFHLGFNSREEFDAMEKKGLYAAILKRARLRVEAAYEKRLLQPSPSGAMFALKNMGWSEKADAEKTTPNIATSLTIKLVETGQTPVSNERDVILD